MASFPQLVQRRSSHQLFATGSPETTIPHGIFEWRGIRCDQINTNNNYTLARQLLTDKYNKYRKIVFSLIDKLLNLESIHKASNIAYNNLARTVRQTLLQLENLKVDMTSWVAILVRIVTSKLDRHCYEKWAFKLSHDEISSIDSVINFINQVADSMSESDNQKKTTVNERFNYKRDTGVSNSYKK